MNRLSLAMVAAAFVVVLGKGTTLRANAATINVYQDKATFLANSNATGTSPFPNLGNGRFTSLTHDNLTFTPTTGNSFSLENYTSRLPGIDLGLNGVEDLNVDIPSLVNFFGFDFVEPQFDPFVNAPFVDSTFQVTLLNGGTIVGAFDFTRPNDVAAFVGVSSDQLFNRVEIREIVGTNDNEFYGRFYTGVASVPEPSSMLGILAFGGVGAGSLLKRKQQQKARNFSRN